MKNLILLFAFLLPTISLAAQKTKLCQEADPSSTGTQIRVIISASYSIQAQLLEEGRPGALGDCKLNHAKQMERLLENIYDCPLSGSANGDFIRVSYSEEHGYEAQYFANGIAGPRAQTSNLQCE